MIVKRLNRVSLFVSIALSYLASEVQANSWLSSEQAFLQTLDKITARIATVPITLNQPFQFGTLEIELKHCAFTPPEVPPEAAAFLEIRDVGFVDNEESDKITVFSGWMFASSPSVSSLEHPVYDVTLLACAK
tara:strand:- start:135 stop:533 length:399 start_codon:yes stop_codon:yes gene_type:complete